MTKNNSCPSCKNQNISVFYDVRNIPLNNCLLLETEKQAINFPIGDVILGFCNQCGFIFNTVYDSSKVDYSSIYEDQQCFSKTFNEFALRLTSNLVKKFNLHDKKILEIGCGKGDFLAMLCSLGNNSGIGIDPAFVQDRIKHENSENLTFIRDFYSDKYSDFTGDFICCRHTLEHIPHTGEFVKILRNSIGKNLNKTVFFEIPDVRRILKECAFWDIYYEHCSYFSPGSLARLFRSCNFEVIDLYLDFNDQYLLIEAKPVNKKSNKIYPLEETIAELSTDLKKFVIASRASLSEWKNRLKEFHNSKKHVAVWGAGSKCVSFFTTLGVKDEIGVAVDINPFRQGKYLPGVGKQVQSPDILKDYNPDVVIIMNPIYTDEIRLMLTDIGLSPTLLSV